MPNSVVNIFAMMCARIRLPRHGASLPVAMAVSCAADRQALGRIDANGIFIEDLERNPSRFMPDIQESELGSSVVHIDPPSIDGRYLCSA